MRIDIVKDILNLKEGEGYKIVEIGVEKGDTVKFVMEQDDNHAEIFEDCLQDFFTLNMKLYTMYENEILADLESEKDADGLIIMMVSVIATSEGNAISIYVPYLDIYKENANELIESIQVLQSKLDKNLNNILNDFVDKEDDIREFELVFKRDNFGGLKYDNFIRAVDRSIPQQKQEVGKLLSLNFEEKLICEASKLGYDLDEISNDKIVFNFSTDMKDIFNLMVGTL